MKESFELEEMNNFENDLNDSKFILNKNSILNYSFITNISNKLNDNKKLNENELLNNKNNNFSFLKSIHSVNINKNYKNIETEENKFLSFFFKFFYVFRERSLNFQVSIFYTIIIIIFIIILLSIKITKINSLFETHSDKNYYSSIVNDMINIERKIKNNIDNYNTIDYYLNFFNINLFFEIYTKILIKNKLILEENLYENLNIDEDFFVNISENFILSENLENLTESNDNNIYIKNLIPFYYIMTPILYQYLLYQNISLSNIFFIGYYNKSNKCNNDYMYFKYPINKKENSIKTKMENNKIFDLLLDPYIICNENDIINKKKYDNYINYNYYKLIENKNYTNKTIIINKKSDENYKFIINSNRFFINDENTKNENISFAIVVKIIENNNSLPFINYDDNNNIKNYDFFSILNLFGENKIYDDNNNLNNENYDINDENIFIIHQPLFIENIFNYGFNSKNNNKTILRFSELNDPEKYYKINYYLKDYDYKFSELIHFLNNFLFKYKYDFNNNNNDSNYCSIKNINEYFSHISKKYSCFNDYCFYNNCELKSKLFIEPEKLNFMPNCYCIPLYCKFCSFSDNNFHKKILKKLNNKKNNYDYTFTSNEEDFIKESKNYFGNINEYFNRNKNYFKCKISFLNKNKSENDFNVDIKILKFFSFGKIFIFSFNNNEKIKNLIKNFNKNTNKNKYILFFIYFFLLIISSVFLLILLIINLKKISEKMKKVKKLRTLIISNNINNNFNKNLNFEENLSKKQRKKNEKNFDEKDFDELDTLIKFINDNINDFNIDLNINNNNNYELNNIKNQYNQILKVNEYKNKIINNFDNNNQNSININNENSNNNFNENEINTNEILNEKSFESENKNFFNLNNNNKNQNNKNEKENISLNLINEFFSLFSKEIYFENIKSNFYYNNNKNILNLKNNLFYFSDIEGGKNEITNFEQLKNSIKYYKNQIENYWKKKYFEEKKQFE